MRQLNQNWQKWEYDNKLVFLEDLKKRNDRPKTLEELRHEEEVMNARSDVNSFLEYTLMDKETRSYIKQAAIHRLIQNSITDYPELMIGIPRDHGKSSQVIGRALKMIGGNPDIRIKIISANDEQAGKRVSAIKNHIEFNPRFHELYPNVLPEPGNWGKTSFTVKREVIDHNPTCASCGVLGSGVGDRADLIIFDDPCDQRNSVSEPGLREKVFEAITNVWLNLLSPNGRWVWIYTPWHTQDAAARFKKQGGCKVIERYVDSNFTPVWEEKWGKPALIKKLGTIGQRAFDRGYGGKAISDEEVTFKNLNNAIDDTISIQEIAEIPYVSTIIGVDLAISKKTNAAYTVIFCLRIDEKGNKAPVHILRKKMGSTATVAWILGLYQKYKAEMVVVEGNAYQKALDEWIEFFHMSIKDYFTKEETETKGKVKLIPNEEKFDEMYHNVLSADITPEEWIDLREHLFKVAFDFPYVKSFVTGKNKADEIIGLPGFASDLESGSWVIPTKDCKVDCQCNVCAWLEEMRDYPIGATKDIIMAGWFAQNSIRDLDFGVRGV